MPTAELKDTLLVASPALRDGNFDRTVVLILEHDPEAGALGLVLNRPSTTGLDEAVPTWSQRADEPAVVFVGGPVEVGSAICLARSPDPHPSDGFRPLFGPLGTLDFGLEPDVVGVPIDGLRIFTGWAGWAPGQLEGEIAAGAWYTVSAEPGDAFSDSPTTLWRAVLQRQRGSLAIVANYPADLHNN